MPDSVSLRGMRAQAQEDQRRRSGTPAAENHALPGDTWVPTSGVCQPSSIRLSNDIHSSQVKRFNDDTNWLRTEIQRLFMGYSFMDIRWR